MERINTGKIKRKSNVAIKKIIRIKNKRTFVVPESLCKNVSPGIKLIIKL